MSPEPSGVPVTTIAYVDASHAANKVTRISHTVFIILRQKIPEASAFSSKFFLMKECVEHINALGFKLRMFGVPIDESNKLLCDNESVVKKLFILYSTLNNKHSSIA